MPGPALRLTADPSSDGSIDVSERVRLPVGTTSLRLVAPDVAPAGWAFAQAQPQAHDVRLSVDGHPVPLSSDTVGASQFVLLSANASSYELRYVLTGVTVRSAPSAPGRALAALTPLSQVEPETLVVVTTSGESVLNLSCPLLRGNAVSCSDGVRGRMAVRDPLPDSAALVVLQLDLTRH